MSYGFDIDRPCRFGVDDADYLLPTKTVITLSWLLDPEEENQCYINDTIGLYRVFESFCVNNIKDLWEYCREEEFKKTGEELDFFKWMEEYAFVRPIISKPPGKNIILFPAWHRDAYYGIGYVKSKKLIRITDGEQRRIPFIN